MRPSLWISGLSAATVLASAPIAANGDIDWRALDERARMPHCKAKEKKKYRGKTITFVKRGPLSADDEDEADEIEDEDVQIGVELVKRKKFHYRCGSSGHLTRMDQPVDTLDHVTMHHCANYCICTIGKPRCRTYGWTPDAGQSEKGTGTCNIYSKGFHKQRYQPGPDPNTGQNTTYYNHHCYRKGQSPRPNHTMKHPEPTAMAKRDSVEDFIVDALLGV